MVTFNTNIIFFWFSSKILDLHKIILPPPHHPWYKNIFTDSTLILNISYQRLRGVGRELFFPPFFSNTTKKFPGLDCIPKYATIIRVQKLLPDISYTQNFLHINAVVQQKFLAVSAKFLTTITKKEHFVDTE